MIIGLISSGGHTHVLLQPFKLGQSIMAQVELLQRNQTFEILHFGDTVRLDRKDLEVAESAQVLLGLRRHRQIRTSQLSSCFQVRTDMVLTSKALILFFPSHSSSSRVNFSRFSIFWQSFPFGHQSPDKLTRPFVYTQQLTRSLFPPSSRLFIDPAAQSSSPSPTSAILFCTR
jgi:hypothetical protein